MQKVVHEVSMVTKLNDVVVDDTSGGALIPGGAAQWSPVLWLEPIASAGAGGSGAGRARYMLLATS